MVCTTARALETREDGLERHKAAVGVEGSRSSLQKGVPRHPTPGLGGSWGSWLCTHSRGQRKGTVPPARLLSLRF